MHLVGNRVTESREYKFSVERDIIVPAIMVFPFLVAVVCISAGLYLSIFFLLGPHPRLNFVVPATAIFFPFAEEIVRVAIIRSPAIRSEVGAATMAICIWAAETAARLSTNRESPNEIKLLLLYASLGPFAVHYVSSVLNFRAKGRRFTWGIAAFLTGFVLHATQYAVTKMFADIDLYVWTVPTTAMLLVAAVNAPQIRRWRQKGRLAG